MERHMEYSKTFGIETLLLPIVMFLEQIFRNLTTFSYTSIHSGFMDL